MTIETHGALSVLLIVASIIFAAVAARGYASWLLGACAVACSIAGTMSMMTLFRRIFAMAHPPPDDQSEPEVVGESDGPGRGCGERRRVDTDGRTTRTILDSQP